MKIIGQLVCGPGEADRWLKYTLDDFARLCDDVIVCLCNATIAEKKLVRSYDFRSYEDNREWGKHQYSIKTDLLKRINSLRGDWVLALDADETVPTLDRESLEDLTWGRQALQIYVVDLWNDETHYSKTLSFWNVRAYKPAATRDHQFLRKPVHCGNAPPYFYTIPAKMSYVPHILLHRGLMLPADRMKKALRYQQYDPHAIHKGQDYYSALLADWSGSMYLESEVKQRVENFCKSL